jgi:hypothetical protein
VLFVLNSSFADWYFRLGSTNAAVSHYQLENIPCPRFGAQPGNVDRGFSKQLDALIDTKDFSAIELKCINLAVLEGCSPTVERVLESLVKFIEREEAARGRIARSDRSHLAENAERCQIVLDKMMLTLLGLGENKHQYLRTRLAEML